MNYKRLSKFIISGGSAAVVEYGSFLLFVNYIKIDVLVANGISFGCGLVVSFLLNKIWVFQSGSAAHREFIKYFILAIVNLLISTLFVGIMINSLGILPFIAKLVMMVLIAIWNYLLFSKLIFKN